ncbi:MAG: MBL fold metallo-hydrolase [Ruminococcaceae bacterium]|nr:MBL fold metallo-hydrolase [Oscillospiraceae bacterium]
MKILTFILGSVRTNAFICVDPETSKCVVIDPGCDGEGIYRKIAERNLTLEYILLTHGHFDHIMACKVLKEKTGAKIAIHAYDNEMLVDPMLSYAMQFAGSNFTCGNADIFLNDGDTINCGNMSFKVIHTPGHTKGSCTFVAEESMFTGDTLFAGDVGRTDLHGGSEKILSNSLKKLFSLEGDYRIYPGHGNFSRLSKEREFFNF